MVAVEIAGFADRHLGPDESQRSELLAALGYATLAELTDAAVPPAIRTDAAPDLPKPLTEAEAQAELAELAAANFPGRAMIGLGYHGTITPPVIRRNVLENPAWYTAYTPYQPEISQGRLEALLAFQTMIADLTGLPTAGASLLDEGTAVAEAVALARRVTRKGTTVLLDEQTLPQTIGVVRTRAAAVGLEVAVAHGPLVEALQRTEAFAVVVQVPGADGGLRSPEELRLIASKAHENGAQVIAATDLLALTRLVPPGRWGADIAVGSSQRFGVPLFYGGPHAGYIAVRAGLERQLPGRLVGVSKDADGVEAYRLALQTREQHIRRERATSNICTAQVLLAVAAAMYAIYHGPRGLRSIAQDVHAKAAGLAQALRSAGQELEHADFFDTLTIRVPGRAAQVVAAARRDGVHLRLADADRVGVSVGEDATPTDLAAVARAFGARYLGPIAGEDAFAGHDRPVDYLTHPIFGAHHSETSMLRFVRALADRDFALDRGMIPLGSCTLKLNPAAAMEPISYPGFANLHPFVPVADAAGMLALIARLEGWLAEITGYDRVSIQPNAGSQGEFAGLMAIRGYHRSRGNAGRDVCLIPASAHGTNAASAAMAGMRVEVVATAPNGSVDLDDLRAKLAKHTDKVAAIMVTYPSTHGVYEDTVVELCDLVHAAGGQVYVDGANLNALLGLARPGKFGADVSHLNLHKTFAIPHGGGGPGVGPVAVREHLAPFLPNHPLLGQAGPPTGCGPISAAPFGSAGVLPISYAFIAMLGGDGLRTSAQTAVLNANYLAKALGGAYPVLYAGANALVAHEVILDLREITKRTHVSVDDVAKRLIDYGFHAPTMSFPVAGTLMVEPTESESKAELDRFVAAMLAIRDEIDLLEAGAWPADDNPLANAPHPLARIAADDWNHAYPRSLGGFPAGVHTGPIGATGTDKYWPPVGRIDGAYGDRNLVCSCPPPQAYAQDPT